MVLRHIRIVSTTVRFCHGAPLNIIMKLHELTENVINFAQARNKRDAMAIQHKQDHDADTNYETSVNDDETESLTVSQLAGFEEWMYVAKKKGRVPGFENLDAAMTYLLADIELPAHITRAKAINWFSSLSEEEREKVRMLAHHADRLLEIFQVLKTKLHGIQDTWAKRFGGKVPRGYDAIEGAAWLDQEFTYDMTALKNLKKAIAILGQ